MTVAKSLVSKSNVYNNKFPKNIKRKGRMNSTNVLFIENSNIKQDFISPAYFIQWSFWLKLPVKFLHNASIVLSGGGKKGNMGVYFSPVVNLSSLQKTSNDTFISQSPPKLNCQEIYMYPQNIWCIWWWLWCMMYDVYDVIVKNEYEKLLCILVSYSHVWVIYVI